MIRKHTLKAASIAALLAMAGTKATAQDIHFTQFEASPLIVNPSFTGGFNGTARVAAIYRNQWQSITTPFSTVAASVDAPIIHDLSVDDYLAAGLQFYSDKAGDANLSNTSVLASVAYHKFLGGGSEPKSVLSVGLQGGYTSKSIDISKLYFGDEFTNGYFNQGSSAEYPFLNNHIHYWNVNAGVSFSQSTSDRFGYTVGVGANNLTQPRESFSRRENSEVGLGMRYNAQVGAIWYTGDRFSIRPGVLYQTQATAYELIAGSEFNFLLGNPEFRSVATSVFVGGWYRNNDAAMITAGVEFKGFRVGASYDYNVSALKDASKGNGGFEISLRYIAPNPLDFARKLIYPCARF